MDIVPPVYSMSYELVILLTLMLMLSSTCIISQIRCGNHAGPAFCSLSLLQGCITQYQTTCNTTTVNILLHHQTSIMH
jgi:hypothetical protein